MHSFTALDPNDGEPTLIALPLESYRVGDLFKEAANNFKVERLFKESGDAYMREAECRVSGGERDDAANAYWNAAKAYKQGYPDRELSFTSWSSAAIVLNRWNLSSSCLFTHPPALGQTVDLLQKLGRFRQAADREKEIGQIYLQENHDVGNAAEAYLRQPTGTVRRTPKPPRVHHEAIKLYDEVAQYSLGSQLTKYNVKEYWLRAGLCALAAQDAVTAPEKV
ncbi:vesicular-fusion protein S17 [Tulasnella sp. 424]|nr:vesicular-fusion protein S17 [Tulasnella sp. 424]KAG8966502.1 vesicular-fusion protein S17 [Tulasnella sp. 425]